MTCSKKLRFCKLSVEFLAFALPSVAFGAWASPQQPLPAESNEQATVPPVQSNANSESAKKAEIPGPDSGSVTDNFYTNGFFGFTFEFPKGWSVQGEDTKKFLTEVGKAAVSGGDAGKKAVAHVIAQRTHRLIGITEHPFGTPVAFNPGISITAADISFAPGIQTGKDFDLAMKLGLPGSRSDLKLIREPEDHVFGGKVFSRMDVAHDSARGDTIYESYVSTVFRGYALIFHVVAQNPDRLETLVQTMNTLEFKPQPETSPGTPAANSPADTSSIRIGPSVRILTPTEGVDFNQYVTGFMASVKRSWYAGMPEAAKKGQKGRVSVLFNIQKNGEVADGPTIESSSGQDPLDQAAIAAVRASSPFEPLPVAFHGPHIRLRIIFLYNLPIDAAEQ